MNFKLLMITFLAISARLSHAGCPSDATQVAKITELKFMGQKNAKGNRIDLNNLAQFNEPIFDQELPSTLPGAVSSATAISTPCIYFFGHHLCSGTPKSYNLDADKINQLLTNQDQIHEEVKEMLESAKGQVNGKLDLKNSRVIVKINGYKYCLAFPNEIYLKN